MTSLTSSRANTSTSSINDVRDPLAPPYKLNLSLSTKKNAILYSAIPTIVVEYTLVMCQNFTASFHLHTRAELVSVRRIPLLHARQMVVNYDICIYQPPWQILRVKLTMLENKPRDTRSLSRTCHSPPVA
jgi:hypothetical protein